MPEGKVRWSLHVVANEVRREGDRRLVFALSGKGFLVVDLPQRPQGCEILRGKITVGVACDYAAEPLTHVLRRVASA
jgi:hypothetical protein